MTTALVTGGTGFIGQHLVSALVARHHKVRVLDRRPPACATPGVDYVSGSVLDAGLVDEALRETDEVYHLAGLPGMWLPKKSDFHAVNFQGTEVVLAAARKRGVKRFLHCSTESILFRSAASPADGSDRSLLPPQQMPGAYTRSKMLAERSAAQAAAEGFPLVIGTPTMPIGPHDHNLTPPTAMLRQFLHGRVHMYLDFIVNMVDVRDVATGLILTMERGQIGHRYILGGESISLKNILKLMSACWS
jgi:dihydroflavonol-4-reductase